MLPYWTEALVYGSVGVIVYLILLRRIRRRHWTRAPEIVLGKKRNARGDGRR